MDLIDYDVCKGPLRNRITYVIPNHPYLSWTAFNSCELDVNLNELTEEMIADSGHLTSEDLFQTRGLKFYDDSLLWAVLVEKNSVSFKRRDKATMTLDGFLAFLQSLRFEECTSPFYRVLTKATALAHFTIAEYFVAGEKRDTLSSHFNRLMELLDSLFLQFFMLRNRCDSNILLSLFELLPNPKEIAGEVVAPSNHLLKNFLDDKIFFSFVMNYHFVVSNLCSCGECRKALFSRFLKRRERGVLHLSDIQDFSPQDLILQQLHLTNDEALRVRESIDKDLGAELILKAMESKTLPILHDEILGNSHLERNILKIYCNIILCLFLARRVRERISRDLDKIARFFAQSLVFLEIRILPFEGVENVCRKLAVLGSHFSSHNVMSIPRHCSAFLEVASILVASYSKQNHRVRALLEHLCQKKVALTCSCFLLHLARELRHDILEGFTNPLKLHYMDNPVRFFRCQDCNLYGTHLWSGLFPNVVPHAVRGGGSFEVRIFEHRMRQRRVSVRKRLFKESQHRGFTIRQSRRIPRLAFCPFAKPVHKDY